VFQLPKKLKHPHYSIDPHWLHHLPKAKTLSGQWAFKLLTLLGDNLGYLAGIVKSLTVGIFFSKKTPKRGIFCLKTD